MDILPEFLAAAKVAVDNKQVEEIVSLLDDQTVEDIFRIIEKDPSKKNLIFDVATLFFRAGQADRAEQCYKRVLGNGASAVAFDRLGCFYQSTGRLLEALECQRKAVELEPNRPELCANLAKAMMETGQMRDGLELLKNAVEQMPRNAQAHSNLLFCMHQLPEPDAEQIFSEHVRWGQMYAPADMARTSHDNVPEPDRKLRIGYISPDFRRNSVAYFFESLLDGHDRGAVEVYGYGNVTYPDQFTERLRSKFDCYHNIAGESNKKVAELILKDGIDILVDLAGHTGDNRLITMAYKPAPVQVTYLGYPDTTGVKAIDYRLTDALADLPQSQRFYTEELFFLPDGFLCYRPADFAPEVTSPAAKRNGYVTFGSFNNNCKVNLVTIGLWAEVLKLNSGSRLLLKFKGGGDPEIRTRYFSMFEQSGIGRDKIIIYGWGNPAEHLQLYSKVDIALDTYPYNGTTTICEALWMGVPTITLVGEYHMSRVGLSILSRVGLGFFAASTPKEYVAKATALAQNIEALSQIRSSMRARVATSGLCYAKGFAHSLEAAYRKMWHRWCRSHT
jgi:protein O-GlcNAc transferase